MEKVVWYISKYFATPSESAAGSRGWYLLKQFALRGHRPVVITSDSNNLVDVPELYQPVTLESKEGIQLVWLRTMSYSVAKSGRRILSWLHFEWNLFILDKDSLPRPDAIIVSSLSLLTIINGLFLKRKYRCKLVFEIRDIWPLTLVEEGGFSTINPFVVLLGFIERIGYKKSDLIIGTMPNLSQHVGEVLGCQRPVACIPMGVADEMLRTDMLISKQYIQQYIDKNFFNIVHAGTVGITNALETFFRAAERMVDNTKIRFVIVGDGSLKNFYLNRYGDLPNVVFAPKVQKSQVYSVLSSADVVYFSTYRSRVWTYGQSLNKVVDYMLSGKPVIASYSGYPSMIDEAGCGYFVPSEDDGALVERINMLFSMSEVERENIGRRGRAWLVENRNYERLSDKYLSLIFTR